MMAASTNGSTSKDSSVPELESRREHETPHETLAMRALRKDRRGERPGTGVYLIEREAIELRRLRWLKGSGSLFLDAAPRHNPSSP
jgi:hypothetical protein